MHAATHDPQRTNGRHRILAIANETLETGALHDLIRADAGRRGAEVLVVAPALNSRLHHWLSDEDGARAGAEARLASSLERLDAEGIDATGWVGDANPLTAIADALVVFDADELIISTHREDRSNWLARDVVRRAEQSFGLPTTHAVAEAVPLAA
jgi:hypothetical protein